jgi:hypothetical protein
MSQGDWYPNPGPQVKAFQSTAYELLYGGAAGGGKSEYLLMDPLKWIKNKNFRAILFRNSYPELMRSLVPRSFNYYPALGGKFNKSDFQWKFPSGAVIDFGYLDLETDMYKYKSAEYAWIGFDELTHFTEDAYKYMMSRNRCPDPMIPKRIRSATNPGGKGHAWVKARFIDRLEPFKKHSFIRERVPGSDEFVDVETTLDNPEGTTIQFIPAKVYDNKVLMENDPDYVKRLEGLKSSERRALLDGDWDIFEGQYFDMWREHIHIIDPLNSYASGFNFLSLDYGYSAPSAVYWHHINSEGQDIIYRELYVKKYTYKQLADLINRHMYKSENIQYMVVDPAVFSKMTGGNKTGAEIFNESGIYCIRGNNDRLTGWSYMRDMLSPYVDFRTDRETAKLLVTKDCPNLIRTLPQMIYDRVKVEDLDTRLEDHAVDSIRYGIMSRYDENYKPEKVEGFEYIIHDPNAPWNSKGKTGKWRRW